VWTKFWHQDNYDDEIWLGADCLSATDNPPLVGADGHAERGEPTTVIEFQIHQAIDRQFYCRIVASNGEVLFISETYHNKQDLVHAANVVRAYATSAQILDYAA
jgi:uncharacterized protein YegP (UPF0339 family)